MDSQGQRYVFQAYYFYQKSLYLVLEHTTDLYHLPILFEGFFLINLQLKLIETYIESA